MTGKKTETRNPRAANYKWLRYVILGAVCAVVIGVFAWSAGRGLLDSASPKARRPHSLGFSALTLTLEPESATSHLDLGVLYCNAGRLDDGMNECQKALEMDPKISPKSAEAQFDLGGCLLQMGQMDEAFAHFEKALEIDPHFAETHFSVENNNFAWSLATNPDPDKRNGPLAVALAEGACWNTHYQTTIMVGTLAAAYAEAGRFDEAIVTAQKACALASKSGDEKLLQKNRELLALYLKHQPYRDEQSNPGK